MNKETSPTSAEEPVSEGGGIRETYRKPIENTPEETHLMTCYADLQSKALDTELTVDESVELEGELREMYQYVSEQPNIDDVLRKDMKEQAKRLVSNFISIKNLNAKFRELEAGTREGRIPWEVRKDIINMLAEAHDRYGLADAPYNAFLARLGDYEFSSGAGDILYREDDK